MFTGIVEEVGQVVSLSGGRLAIGAATVLGGTKLGDSILVNGACLTVTTLESDAFWVDVVSETFRRTNLGDLSSGSRVNLERAAPVDGRLGGHIVQGHIEGTAEIVELRPDGADGLMVYYRPPSDLMRYIVGKGFIAVDGASLTVVGCDGQRFWVTLIPFTRLHTNLGERRSGDRVNIETDIVARYVERFIGFATPPASAEPSPGGAGS
ncbi:MAG: riboflavin synthase [Dehalococcoidia bacterium]|nr:riboflavin synthase [Dehalococcoidia bacterium]